MSLDVTIESEDGTELFWSSITHNLIPMAEALGIYEVVWSPEEHGIVRANQLIEPLLEGITKMLRDPETYKKHDSSNGWGTYKDFLPWLQRYLQACQQYPDGLVSSSR